jgi:gluconokinase
MTWADTRSNQYAVKLKKTDKGDVIYQRTGTPIHPMSPLCKIAWIKGERIDIFTAAHKFISIKEYIFYHLFGEFVIDYAIASATGLFDIHELQWCDEALQFAGISADKLSRLVSTDTAFSELKKEYSSQLNLPANILFLIGAGDGFLANIGAGAILADELALTIGTSGAVRKIGEQPVNDPGQRLFNYAIDGKTFLTGGAINNGGIVLTWVIKTFLDNNVSDEEGSWLIMEKAATVPAGADGLIFLPYIYGERAPVWDASAKGVFLGITPLHTKAHFIRAVLEGICFSFLQIVKTIEETSGIVNIIYANGGFIQSKLWLRIMADVLNKRICVSHKGDASAMGSIFLAMHYLKEIKNWSEVKRLVSVDEEFYPDQQAHHIYLQNYALYEHLYDKLKEDFQKIDFIQIQGEAKPKV